MNWIKLTVGVVLMLVTILIARAVINTGSVWLALVSVLWVPVCYQVGQWALSLSEKD